MQILSTSLLVGDAGQLDYSKIQQSSDNYPKPQRATDLSTTMFGGGGDHARLEAQRASKDVSNKPMLLFTKYQWLKNSATKMARVYFVDETRMNQDKSGSIASLKPQMQPIPTNSCKPTTTDTEKVKTSQESEDSDDFCDLGSKTESNADSKSTPLALMYYPERFHTTNAQECLEFNSRIMNHIMKQKMGKNQSFNQTKTGQQQL